MTEFNTAKSMGGLKDKTPIIDKGGRRENVNEYEQISYARSSYYLGKLPRFLKISKIGGNYLLRGKHLYPGDLQSLAQCALQRGISRDFSRRTSPPFGHSGIGDDRSIFLEFSLRNTK